MIIPDLTAADLPPGTVELACHAALPVAVDPTLVNLLRINFLLAERVPYEAEADLLLSPVFRDVGSGLFEMDPPVRDELLTRLYNHYDQDRIHQVAHLLWRYTEQNAAWRDRPELTKAQQLTALNVVDPDAAAAWLATGESAANAGRDTTLADAWFVAMHHQLDTQPARRAVAETPRPAEETTLTKDEIWELAKAASESRRLLERAGMPRGLVPGDARTPIEFWTMVNARLAAGQFPDGRRRILTEAASLFPANTAFAAGLERSAGDVSSPAPGALTHAETVLSADNVKPVVPVVAEEFLNLDVYAFENLVHHLLLAMTGNEVTVQQASVESGFDFQVVSGSPLSGDLLLVEAKLYRRAVPVSAVRALAGAMADRGAARGMLITTSWFGQTSAAFAGRNRITLVDGSELRRLVQRHLHVSITDERPRAEQRADDDAAVHSSSSMADPATRTRRPEAESELSEEVATRGQRTLLRRLARRFRGRPGSPSAAGTGQDAADLTPRLDPEGGVVASDPTASIKGPPKPSSGPDLSPPDTDISPRIPVELLAGDPDGGEQIPFDLSVPLDVAAPLDLSGDGIGEQIPLDLSIPPDVAELAPPDLSDGGILDDEPVSLFSPGLDDGEVPEIDTPDWLRLPPRPDEGPQGPDAAGPGTPFP